jgi:transcriptional regulator with XRE-family HTH domain
MNETCAEIMERMKRAGGLKNYTAVAERLGITPQAVSNYKKKGKMPPGLIIRFAELYGLSVDWLLTGMGDMYRPHDFAMEGEVTAFSTLDQVADRRGVREGVKRFAGLLPMSPDEIIFMGKLLKILRGSNKQAVDVLKLSVDALLKASEQGTVAELGLAEGEG